MNNLSLRRFKSSLVQLQIVLVVFLCHTKKLSPNCFSNSILKNKFKPFVVGFLFLIFSSLTNSVKANNFLSDSLTLRKSISKNTRQDVIAKSTKLSNKQSQQIGKPADSDVLLKERIKQTLKENAQTLRFMENKGQLANKDILYYFEGTNGAAYIEKNKIRFVANDDTLIQKNEIGNSITTLEKPEMERVTKATHGFNLTLNNSNQSPKISLGESFVTTYNYFLGKDAKDAITNVKAAKDLTIENIYEGINLRLYSTPNGALEFDWILKPGADYKKLQLHFEGQDNLSIDQEGSLLVGLRFTTVKFHIPESYQITKKGKIPVDFTFEKTDKNTIAFTTKNIIDTRYALVIDPILLFGTFVDGNLGTSGNQFDQYLFAIQVDPIDGTVYCAGASNKNIPTNSAPYNVTGYLNTISGLDGAPSGGVPCAAIVYSMNASGNQLLNLTLYGPSSLSSGNAVQAYCLSLSPTRVFISGYTNVDIPVTGNAFDNTRDNNDGFIAAFSKNLSSLQYATYIGGSGNDTRGVTAIRAIDDNSYIIGATIAAALPTSSPNYISSGAAQTAFLGTSDFYIAKFSSLNSLVFGTYFGTSGNETFNDLEILPDNSIAFCGYGTGLVSEVNSAAGRSTGSDEDGIIGVLNSSGTAFTYLDQIGGSGNDRILDLEFALGKLYFTGSASSGFPTSVGAYNTSHSGGTDVVVGTVDVGGSTGYKATFYGTSGTDLGNGIKLISRTSCTGLQTQTYLFVFGTVGASGLPTKNVNGESFYDASYNGGLDIFFACFKSNLDSLFYGTYIGGTGNDYLGNTGDPRGANQIWVNGANVFCGTTTHSNSVIEPLILSGGFDITKDNTTNDSHIIMGIQFASLLVSDFGDAPSGYGMPSHVLDCTKIRIGALQDEEGSAQPSTLANADDLTNMDDEDGITTLPVLITGGPQNVSVTVNNILNTTGKTANLYGWIDFNSDGQFSANEFTSISIPDGTNNGSFTLNWTGVSVSGNASNHYLRVRLTSDNLSDNSTTSSIDERSTLAAGDGEVEDYVAIEVSCPSNRTEDACQTQTAINTKFATWLALAQAGGGGCSTTSFTNNSSSAPNAVTGGSVTITFTYTTTCSGSTPGGGTFTCNATFTVLAPTLSIGTSQTNVNCFGQSTGSATATPSAGTAPYTYSWNTSPIKTTATATGLAAGTYTVTVTDNKGCIVSANVTITQPSAALSSSVPTQTNVSCFGQSTGTATASATGGTAPYTYSWNTSPVQTTITATGLAAGTYTVTVTDNKGCTSTANVTITQPTAALVASVPTKVNVNCFGQSTGTATASATGGTAPYTYSWNTSPVQTTITATGLAAGTYTVTVTDNKGCTSTSNVTITQPAAALSSSVPTQTNVNCFGQSTGSATASATGGTSPYTYSWNTSPIKTTATATGLAAGTYTVTVTDNKGCTSTSNVTITQPRAALSQVYPPKPMSIVLDKVQVLQQQVQQEEQQLILIVGILLQYKQQLQLQGYLQEHIQ